MKMDDDVVLLSSEHFSHPGSYGGLYEGDVVVVPLNGGHGDPPGQVASVVAGGGKDDPLLSGDVLAYISSTPVVLRRPR